MHHREANNRCGKQQRSVKDVRQHLRLIHRPIGPLRELEHPENTSHHYEQAHHLQRPDTSSPMHIQLLRHCRRLPRQPHMKQKHHQQEHRKRANLDTQLNDHDPRAFFRALGATGVCRRAPDLALETRNVDEHVDLRNPRRAGERVVLCFEVRGRGGPVSCIRTQRRAVQSRG
ncbi:hypothetical protein ACN47E_008207 [Coniothyrium glycines]